MEDEVRIPVILTTDKSSLSKVKEEIEKTVSKAQEYEKNMSSKRKTYRVKGLEDTALQMDNLIAKIGELQSAYSTISDRGPFDKLKKAHEDVAEAVRSLAKDTEELRNLNNSLGGKSNAKNQAEVRLKALQEQTEELQKQKELELQTAKDNGESKKKLAEIEQEYSARQKVLESKKQEANIEFLAKRAVYDRVLAERDAAKESEASSREKLDQLRAIEAEEAKRTSHPDYESQYAQAQSAELEKLKELIREYGEELENVKHKYEEMLQADKEASGYAEKERAAEKLKAAENGVADATKKSADASKDESNSNKDSTAQFYYKLRAIKMLGHTIDQAYRAMDRFGKKSLSVAKSTLSAYMKLLPGVWAVQKAMQKATTNQKKFGREVGATTRAHESFNVSLKKGLTTVLKYGFGIRSLYILFRKLRKAITDGIGEMSQQFEDVNVRMSSILTSVNYMKASLTTIAEPLITLLAPALEKIAEIVANISYHVASFIAALSGQKNVYKAIKVQADYAESLDKTAKNAKKAKKELAGFDELNVLHSNDDDDKDYTMGWELVPALAEAFPIIDKIKSILSTLFDPIKKAWEKMKDFVINSFKYMVEKLKSLLGTIWDDFLKVWTDGRVQKIFEDIFKIIGDIFLIVGNLAEAFEEAWKANDNGYRILSAIVDILGIIVDGIKRCADITVEWSKKLTFVPLFTAIADVMEQQVVPAVQKVVDLFVYLYEHVFLELVRYVVEDLAPTLVRAFGNVIETVGNIADKIREALETNDLGDKIIAQFEKLVTIVGDKILEVSEKTKEWSKGLDFTALFEAVLHFLEKIEPLVQTVANVVGALWTDVLLPFWEYIIEDGGPRLLDLLGQIFGQKDENTGLGIDWEKVANDINALLPALEQFLELAWDVLLQIIKDLGKAFDDFVNSDNFTKIIEGFKDWVDNADPEEIAHKIETLVETFVGLYATFKLFAKVIMPVVTGIMTVGNAINNLALAKTVGDIAKAVGVGGAGGAAAGGGSGLAGALSGLMGPALIAVAAIALIIGAFGGIEGVIEEVKERIQSLIDFFKNAFEKAGIAEKFEELKNKFKDIFDKFSVDLQKLRPVFEAVLDIFENIAKFLGGEFIAMLDGGITALEGVVDFIIGVIETITSSFEILGGVLSGDTERIQQGWDSLKEGLSNTFRGIIEVATGLFEFFGDSIANFVNILIPGLGDAIYAWIDDTVNAIKTWVEDVIKFFTDLKYQLIGDPIVYDIQDGVEEGFSGFIEETLSGVTDWVKDVIGKFSDLKDNIGEGIKGAKDAVVNKFTEIKEGIFGESAETKEGASNDFSTMAQSIMTTLSSNPLTEAATQFIGSFKTGIDTEFPLVTADIDTNIATILQNFATNFSSLTLLDEAIAFLQGALTGFQQIWPSITQFIDSSLQALLTMIKGVINGQTLPEAGMEFIQGLNDALVQSFGVTLEEVVSNLEEILSSFREYLDPRTLYNIFIDFMQGGEDGLMSKLQSLLARVTEICNQIIAKVEAVFDIGSPSKVFFGIGEYLMEGMANGIEEDKSEVTDSFNDLVPDDSFTDKFIRSLDVMKNRAVDVVTTMADSMGDVMDNLDLVSSVDTMYNGMKKLDKIKVPNIAVGSVLPSTPQFRGANQYDPSQMANAVKSAMIESMADMRYNETRDSVDLVVNIDGYEVFRAVRNQSDMFKSSAGYGVL